MAKPSCNSFRPRQVGLINNADYEMTVCANCGGLPHGPATGPRAWMDADGLNVQTVATMERIRADYPATIARRYTIPLYAIDDETRGALLAGIQALRQAGGYTMTVDSAEKHIATLERLRGE